MYAQLLFWRSVIHARPETQHYRDEPHNPAELAAFLQRMRAADRFEMPRVKDAR